MKKKTIFCMITFMTLFLLFGTCAFANDNTSEFTDTSGQGEIILQIDQLQKKENSECEKDINQEQNSKEEDALIEEQMPEEEDTLKQEQILEEKGALNQEQQSEKTNTLNQEQLSEEKDAINQKQQSDETDALNQELQSDEIDTSVDISYSAHIKDIGWQDSVSNGEIAGTTGQAIRMEAIIITGLPEEYAASIEYRSHVQDLGWEEDWSTQGGIAGTTGKALQMEALQIRLTGKMSELYDIYYQVHIQNYGWLDWASNGKEAGSEGYALQMEAVRIVLVLKNSIFDGKQDVPFIYDKTPVVYITTCDGVGNTLTKDSGYTSANIVITEADGTTLEESGQVKIHGNSTARSEKKAYKIKFDNKQNVLNMGKAKKWTLLANSYDPTMVRNAIVFNTAQQMELAYTSEYQYVELYLDGIYKGMYMLVEPVEAGKNRVDIDVDSEDFMIETETNLKRADEDVTYIVLNNGQRFAINEPEDTTEEQAVAIKDYLNDVVDIMQNGTYEELCKIIDIESFAKNYILNDLFKTVDIAYSSVRFYRKNGILYAGPVWDFDLSMGNTYTPDEFHRIAIGTQGQYAGRYNLFQYLTSYEEFMEKAVDVYHEYYSYFCSIYEDNGMIDTIITEYSKSIEKNYTKGGWDPSVLYDYVQGTPAQTYKENVANLKKWLKERNEWMSNYYQTSNSCIEYSSYVDNIGWLSSVNGGDISGTTGKAIAIKSFCISLDEQIKGKIYYQSHIQNIGWEDTWKENGNISGTTGNALHIEAIRIRLDEKLAAEYSIKYRVHIENIGWMDWVYDGDVAGTTGKNLAIEAIEIILLYKKEC